MALFSRLFRLGMPRLGAGCVLVASLALGGCAQSDMRASTDPQAAALPAQKATAVREVSPAVPPPKPVAATNTMKAEPAAPGPAEDQVALVTPRPPDPRPALDAAPASMPQDPVARARILSRPPVAPPFDAGAEAVASQAATPTLGKNRCTEGVRESRSAVLAFLSLPAQRLKDADWVENALRVTELAAIACDGQGGDKVVAYWRSTAFFLHGQYARAAVTFRRLAEDRTAGEIAAFGYVDHVAGVLEACARTDRAGLDAWRLAGLNHAMGRRAEAVALYVAAGRSTCPALAMTAKIAASAVTSP